MIDEKSSTPDFKFTISKSKVMVFFEETHLQPYMHFTKYGVGRLIEQLKDILEEMID